MPGRTAAAVVMAKPGGPRGRKEGVAGERTGKAIGRGRAAGAAASGPVAGCAGEGIRGGVPGGNGKGLRGSRGSEVSVPPSISFFGAAAGVAWVGRPQAGRKGLHHGFGSAGVTAGVPLPAIRALPGAWPAAWASASATTYWPRSAAAAVATAAPSSAGGKRLEPPARCVSTMRSQKRRGASLQGKAG